jgi:hypothetical protein
MRRIMALALLGGTAGCGGGGGGGTPADGSTLVSHEDQARALDAAAARLTDLDFTASPPTSGTATYAGHLGATAVFGDEAPVFVTAAVELTARFGNGTISGGFSNATSADRSVTGSGAFGGGTMGGSGIETTVSGTLTHDGVAHGIDGGFRGTFLGPGAQGVVGAIEADLLRDGAAAGRFDGEVWAEN